MDDLELPPGMGWTENSGPAIRWENPAPGNYGHVMWVEHSRDIWYILVLKSMDRHLLPTNTPEKDIKQIMWAIAWTL